MRAPIRIYAPCLIALALVTLSGLVIGEAKTAFAQDSELVLDQRFVEIEEVRWIGLSPDGKWLAATDSPMDELCVYEVETLVQQSCASLEPLLVSRLHISDVSWSPDSTRLVLAERSFQFLKDGDLWVMDAMTGSLANITDDGYEGNMPLRSEDNSATFSFDVSPAWTPDGQAVTYSRSLWVNGAFAGNDIATVPATGGEPQSLVTVDAEKPGVTYLGMEWTADGRHLYYSVDNTEKDDPENGIYRYDKEGGSVTQVLGPDAEMGAPAVLQVSPLGDHLLIWYPAFAGRYSSSGPLYWLLNTDDGAIQPLVPPGEQVYEYGWVNAVCFSPDGRAVLTGTRMTNPDSQLWMTEIATGESTRLIESLPGVMIMDYGMVLSWTASGRIFVPATIGSGTLLTVAPLAAPPIASPPTGQEGAAALPGVGQTVYVNAPGVPLYAAPSAMAQPVLLVDAGAAMTVLGPPEVVDGVVWIPVQDQASRTIGYIRSEFLTGEAGQ